MTTITRADYMQASAQLHDNYYRQFVTPATVQVISDVFGVEKLRKALSKDPNLNNIALSRWERVCFTALDARTNSGRFYATLPINRDKIVEAGESVTRAVLVCIAKAAARVAVEQSAQDTAA